MINSISFSRSAFDSADAIGGSEPKSNQPGSPNSEETREANKAALTSAPNITTVDQDIFNAVVDALIKASRNTALQKEHFKPGSILDQNDKTESPDGNLGIDSLTIVEAIDQLEKQFDIEIPYSDKDEGLHTVQDLTLYIQKLKAEKIISKK